MGPLLLTSIKTWISDGKAIAMITILNSHCQIVAPARVKKFIETICKNDSAIGKLQRNSFSYTQKLVKNNIGNLKVSLFSNECLFNIFFQLKRLDILLFNLHFFLFSLQNFVEVVVTTILMKKDQPLKRGCCLALQLHILKKKNWHFRIS